MLIPHSDEVQLEDAEVSKDFLAVFTRRNGLQVSFDPHLYKNVLHAHHLQPEY